MATVHVSDTCHDLIKGLAEEMGKTPQQVVEEAIEKCRHDFILKRSNDVLELLRKDPISWGKWQKEARNSL